MALTSAVMRYLGCAYILHQTWLESRSRPHQSQAPSTCASSLIPRRALFGNPEVRGAALSPDGRFLAYLRPWQGVLNIFTLSVEDSLKQDGLLGGKQLTFERKRSPGSFDWTYQPGVLLYSLDNDGDENYRIVKANATDGTVESVTEPGRRRATVHKLSGARPDVIVIQLNDEDPKWPHLYYVNLLDGRRSLCFNNSVGMRSMHLDSQLRVRVARKVNDDASESYFKVDQDGELTPYYEVSFEEAPFNGVYSVSKGDDSKLSWKVGYGKEYPDLLVKPIDDPDAEGELIHRPKHSEARSVELSDFAWPVSRARPIFVVEDPGRPVKTLLDQTFKEEFEFLNARAAEQGGDWTHMGYSDDLRIWLISMDYADAGSAVFFFFPDDLSLRLLYVDRTELANYRLAKMHVHKVDIEDGLKMVCYLSVPRMEDVLASGVPMEPLPMVLKVHGGPWARTKFGFDQVTQWLVNRGYAVLDCNFRMSRGLGRSLFRAGWGEWAGKMHGDLLDAVDWAVRLGVARRDRVAIYGRSYGGYAALVGLSFTPEVFACGVDIVGPSSIATLLESTPAHWTSFYSTIRRYIGGDPKTEEGRAFLAARSPLTFAHRITKPLLVVQGANDIRVTIQEADQIVDAMKASEIPVTYVVFPDEGHSIRRPENEEAHRFFVETFLRGCLGGRAEPAAPGLLQNSSAQVRETGGLDLPLWTPPKEDADP